MSCERSPKGVAAADRTPLVRFDDVALGYGQGRVIERLRFVLQRGDFLGIVGPNGAGKSTILRALVGTLAPLEGRIVYERALHREIRFGYVPQRHTLDDLFPITVGEVVRMARYPAAGVLRRPGSAASAEVERALDAVGIGHLADRPIGRLSGGQRQRALIARALATGGNVLVLDEPTDGMDLASQHAILGLITRLHREAGLTIVFVSHVLNEVATYVDRIMLLDDGRSEAGPVDEVLTGARLSSLYGIPVDVARVGGATVVVTQP